MTGVSHGVYENMCHWILRWAPLLEVFSSYRCLGGRQYDQLLHAVGRVLVSKIGSHEADIIANQD